MKALKALGSLEPMLEVAFAPETQVFGAPGCSFHCTAWLYDYDVAGRRSTGQLCGIAEMTAGSLEWRAEETCLNAWPALRQVLFSGWLLRFSEGLSRRANSANPLKAPCEHLDTLIAASEALYRTHRLPTIFRLPSIAEPALDERLELLGYGREGESCVLYGDIEYVAAASDPEVQLSSHPSPEWLTAMTALQRHTLQESGTYRRIVGAIAIPAAFAALPIEGEIVALAYGAIHQGLLCYESVITDFGRQRRGYGRRIITALAAWGKDQGVEGACLEVEARNAPARALYDAIGLKRELYRYHYRREPGLAGRTLVTKL